MRPILEARGIAKSYVAGLGRCWARVQVLREVSFAIEAGERVLLTGARGAGKTTLLHCLTGLRRPDAGIVRWEGRRGPPYRLCIEPGQVAAGAHACAIVDLPDDPPSAGDFVEALYGGATTRRGWLVLARCPGPLAELAHRSLLLHDGMLHEHRPARPRRVAEHEVR